MQADILKLLQQENGQLDGSCSFDLSKQDFKDFALIKPASLSFKAVYSAGSVQFNYTLQTRLKTNCSRCLEEFEKDFSLSKSYSLSRQDIEQEFPELPFLANGCLDLEEFSYQELVLEIFPIFICSEDCAGICTQCGNAKSACGCKQETQGDERLQILKQLLLDDEDN